MSDNAIEIPRANAAWDNYPCWIPVVDNKDVKQKPCVICKCGEITSIGNHHVHADGRVTNSYFHQNSNKDGDGKGCQWHVYIKLKDYDQGEFLPKYKQPSE